MLDEIINYVQSLQNQVEVSCPPNTKKKIKSIFHIKDYQLSNQSSNFVFLFFGIQFLSMKLTAASQYYDFNSDTDTLETIQVKIKPNSTHEILQILNIMYPNG